jgi:hypothetical protein
MMSVLLFLTNNELCGQAFKSDSREQYTSEGKRIYNTSRLKQNPPHIDGILNDECWKEGYWSGQYKQFIPAEGKDPSEKTELKIIYDDNNLYVAIRAFDNEPGKIDRQMARRDEFRGDIVGVCFDSYFDHRTGFEFDLTAAGSKIDLVLLNDGWDTNWNPVWHGKVGKEDSAWTAEFQIPLSQLRYGNKKDHIWGLHSWRWINRNQEEDQWNLMPRDNPGYLYSIGELHGIHDISRKRKMEVMPYVVGKFNTFEEEPGNPYATGKKWQGSAGLDGKIGISSDFTLDYTINPDFGQVEADPSVLNLSAFEVFYEEKRPFFLEGKNILDFDFGNDLLFYSRRIGHQPMCTPQLEEDEYAQKIENTAILGALKLTGKTKNGLSIGIIESLTAFEQVEISAADQTRKEAVEPLSNYFIGRVQKDINKSNTMIGGMITSTHRSLNKPNLMHLNREAYTGGFDFRHHWKAKTFFIDTKMVFSRILGTTEAIDILQRSSARYCQRPDATHLQYDSTRTSMNGLGGSLEIGKGSNGKWRYSLELNWRSPGLDLNDVGYLQTSDLVDEDLSLGYVENDPKGIFRNYTVFVSQSNSWNFGGEYLQSRYRLSLESSFRNKWGIGGSSMYQGPSYNTWILRGGPGIHMKGFIHNRYSVHSDVSRKASFRIGIHFHHFFDQVSSMNDIFSGITYRINNPLKLSLDMNYIREKDLNQYVQEISLENDKRFLLATINRKTLDLTIRVDYAITPELTIQYYGNPYFSAGLYQDFKRVQDPEAFDNDQIFYTFMPEEITYNPEYNEYSISEVTPDQIMYTFANPDFNFKQFRSNLVARWEYKPGSTLFLVWTHGRSGYDHITDYSIQHSMDDIREIHADNVFLIKLNYWFQI